MLILSCDPSTKSAIALLDETGIIKTDQLKTSKDDTDLKRGVDTADWLHQSILEHQPDMVILENYAMNAKFNLVTMVTIGTCIRNMLYREKICWYDVAPKTLKLWLTGKGTATKKDMISHVKRRFGFETKNDDIADGVALSYLGAAMFYEDRAAFDTKDLHNAEYFSGISNILFDKTK